MKTTQSAMCMPACWRLNAELLAGRLGGITEVEGLLNDAIAEVRRAQSGSRGADAEGSLACRAFFRLAHFADQLYRHADAQMRSPEWATRKSVIQHKGEQACQEQWQTRLRYKECKDCFGQPGDCSSCCYILA